MKEYYSIKEIAEEKGISIKTVRRKIKEIDVSKELLHKGKNGIIKIHHLLLPRFGKKKQSNNEFAYSLDLPNYDEKDVYKLLTHVVNQIDTPTKIEYVTERKKAKNMLHIHSIITTGNKQKFLDEMHLYFSENSYKIKPLFDREGWIEYITKQNKNIITITNKN